MQFHEFIGQVQHRARLPEEGEALKVTRATLTTLAERLHGGEGSDLGAQLPTEIRGMLADSGESDAFDLDEFLRRVSDREGTDLPVAVHHARAVMDVLKDAVSKGEMEDVRAQLPQEYASLFESGSEGEMRH